MSESNRILNLEKFWREAAAKDLVPLEADTLGAPSAFWRPQTSAENHEIMKANDTGNQMDLFITILFNCVYDKNGAPYFGADTEEGRAILERIGDHLITGIAAKVMRLRKALDEQMEEMIKPKNSNAS